MAEEQGTFELITRHLVLAVAPLRQAVADLDSFRVFLRRLGWEATSIPQPYQDLAGTVDEAIGAIEALVADPDPDDVAAVLDKARELYGEIEEITQAPAGISAADVGTFLGELAERVLELLLVEYLAAALPRVYRALTMLGVIETEWHDATATRPAYLRTRLRYDELPKLFTDPGSLPAACTAGTPPGSGSSSSATTSTSCCGRCGCPRRSSRSRRRWRPAGWQTGAGGQAGRDAGAA